MNATTIVEALIATAPAAGWLTRKARSPEPAEDLASAIDDRRMTGATSDRSPVVISAVVTLGSAAAPRRLECRFAGSRGRLALVLLRLQLHPALRTCAGLRLVHLRMHGAHIYLRMVAKLGQAANCSGAATNRSWHDSEQK